MLFLEDTNGNKIEFDTIIEAQKYIEIRHAEEGGWDWICEVTDDKGNQYGCSWKLELEEI
jgi:hypothetical protein